MSEHIVQFPFVEGKMVALNAETFLQMKPDPSMLSAFLVFETNRLPNFHHSLSVT
jgi:hypothetical protein